jgi:hypothetical protein
MNKIPTVAPNSIEPTFIDLLNALPANLNAQARLTMLILWEDAGRCSGPVEMTVERMRAVTKISKAAQYRAIDRLRAAGLLTEARRYEFAGGSRWVRFLTSPLPSEQGIDR